MALAEYDSPGQPKRHWLIYTNTKHYLVHATEDAVWKKQHEYISNHMANGARMDQISFVYVPVSVTLLAGVK